MKRNTCILAWSLIAGFSAAADASRRDARQPRGVLPRIQIKGFPMALILNGDGKKVGETGYRKGGAKPYAEHLLDIKKKR